LEWPKVNIGRLRDLTLKAAISMLFLIYFLDLDVQKGVAPDIAAALKINLDYGKRTDFWHLVLLEKKCLV
jgi:hypothetical protein